MKLGPQFWLRARGWRQVLLRLLGLIVVVAPMATAARAGGWAMADQWDYVSPGYKSGVVHAFLEGTGSHLTCWSHLSVGEVIAQTDLVVQRMDPEQARQTYMSHAVAQAMRELGCIANRWPEAER